MGGIAIIASSSRSRSDFEKDLEVEIFRYLEIWTVTQPGPFGPGPELDNTSNQNFFDGIFNDYDCFFLDFFLKPGNILTLGLNFFLIEAKKVLRLLMMQSLNVKMEL